MQFLKKTLLCQEQRYDIFSTQYRDYLRTACYWENSGALLCYNIYIAEYEQHRI